MTDTGGHVRITDAAPSDPSPLDVDEFDAVAYGANVATVMRAADRIVVDLMAAGMGAEDVRAFLRSLVDAGVHRALVAPLAGIRP